MIKLCNSICCSFTNYPSLLVMQFENFQGTLQGISRPGCHFIVLDESPGASLEPLYSSSHKHSPVTEAEARRVCILMNKWFFSILMFHIVLVVTVIAIIVVIKVIRIMMLHMIATIRLKSCVCGCTRMRSCSRDAKTRPPRFSQKLNLDSISPISHRYSGIMRALIVYFNI